MAGIVRVGQVSRINYDFGMVAVTYPDREDCVTQELPCLAAGEFNMPAVGDCVAVIHLSSGTEGGICLGTITSEKQMPKVNGKGNFYKKLGAASMQTVAGSLSFSDASGSISIAEILAMKEKLERF